MGNYTYTQSWNTEITDKEKLKEIREKHKDKEFNVIEEDNRINWLRWEGHKIYGYFYDDFVEYIEDLAKAIEGEIELMEEQGIFFKLIFEDGKVYLREGEVIYKDNRIRADDI